MGLFRKIFSYVVKLSPTDPVAGYMVEKIEAGENISMEIEDGWPFGEKLVISANKTEGRRVLYIDSDTTVEKDVFLVVVDASCRHVVVTLPPAHDYTGHLSIVCSDASHGIEIVPNASTENVIFDMSSATFHAKGDSITLVSDRGYLPDQREEFLSKYELGVEVEAQCHDECFIPGTWFIVGRYAAQWYA